MALKTRKSIFYHIPKTGGQFVQGAMRAAIARPSGCTRVRVDHDSVDNEMAYLKRYLAHTLQLKRAHYTQWDVGKKQKDGLFSFAFVREPLDWYKSFWSFRKPGYEAGTAVSSFPLDFAFDPDFEKFIVNVTRMYPLGFVSILYKCFLGQDGDELDFVGRQENLREDLTKALTLAGENFNKETIMKLEERNISSRAKGFSENMELPRGLKRVLMKRERWVFDTFYK